MKLYLIHPLELDSSSLKTLEGMAYCPESEKVERNDWSVEKELKNSDYVSCNS